MSRTTRPWIGQASRFLAEIPAELMEWRRTETTKGERTQAHIDFRGEGVKRILLRYAPITKL